jgi:4-hydroxy-3-polyprenylbenzoate decarboxylase
LVSGPEHGLPSDTADPLINSFCWQLERGPDLTGLQLIVVVDDSGSASKSWRDFLWQTFTRSDPASDSYGLGSFSRCKHWGCTGALVIDARLKSYHPEVLESDPEVKRRVKDLAGPGGPLHGLF